MFRFSWRFAASATLLGAVGCSQQQTNIKPPPAVVTEKSWKEQAEENYRIAIEQIDADANLSAEMKTKNKAQVKAIHEQRLKDFERELESGS